MNHHFATTLSHPRPAQAKAPTAASENDPLPSRGAAQAWRKTLVAVLAGAACSAALAAGSVRYEVHDPESRQKATLNIEWLDTQRVRMETSMAEMPKGMQAWTLLLGDKLYAVNIHEGQTMVMEMGPMLRMAGRMSQATPSDGLDDMDELQEFRATGQRETVAGVVGEVYQATWRDGSGRVQSTELVLSSDRTVVELTQAMQSITRQMGAAVEKKPAAGRNDLERRLEAQQLGLLRVGDQMRAVEVSRSSPAAERFALPAQPMAMPDLSGLAGLIGAATGAAATQAKPEAESRDPNVLERQAARQQQRVQERAEQETNQAADNAVDKALGRLLDRLRNR